MDYSNRYKYEIIIERDMYEKQKKRRFFMKKNVPYNKIDIVRDLKEMVTHNSKKFGEKAAFEYAGKDGKISKSFIQLEKDVFALGSYFY